MSCSLNHCRVDRAHCLAPGLYRCLGPGQRRSGLNVSYRLDDWTSLTFRGRELLGADDLRIVQVILASVGLQQIELPPVPLSEAGRELRDRLAVEGEWRALDSRVAEVTYNELAMEMGYKDWSGGGAKRKVAESVKRLSMTEVHQYGPESGSSRLIAQITEGVGRRERVLIAVNPRLARALEKGAGGRYTRLCLDEVRLLNTASARILHQRLCAWLDRGRSAKLRRGTLVGYCYPAGDDVRLAAVKHRQRRVQRGLEELRALGWTVQWMPKGYVTIDRPS